MKFNEMTYTRPDIDALLANGAARVVALDNFSTGRRENLASALRDPRFELIEADIRDLDACRKAASLRMGYPAMWT